MNSKMPSGHPKQVRVANKPPKGAFTGALVGGENALARCDNGVGNASQLILLLRREVVTETRHD